MSHIQKLPPPQRNHDQLKSALLSLRCHPLFHIKPITSIISAYGHSWLAPLKLISTSPSDFNLQEPSGLKWSPKGQLVVCNGGNSKLLFIYMDKEDGELTLDPFEFSKPYTEPCYFGFDLIKDHLLIADECTRSVDLYKRSGDEYKRNGYLHKRGLNQNLSYEVIFDLKNRSIYVIDDKLYVYDLDTLNRVKTVDHIQERKCVTFSEQNNLLAVTKGQDVKIYNVPSFALQKHIKIATPKAFISGLCFHIQLNLLIVSVDTFYNGKPGYVDFYDLSSGMLKHTLTLDDDWAPGGLAVHPQTGLFVVCDSRANRLYVFG